MRKIDRLVVGGSPQWMKWSRELAAKLGLNSGAMISRGLDLLAADIGHRKAPARYARLGYRAKGETTNV
jgi:hypothetical protein